MEIPFSRERIFEILEEVKDPEIPVISVVDLGIIADVKEESGTWTIEMIPTFSGCPALERMESDIIEVLNKHGLTRVKVKVLYNRPWSSNMISNKGKVQLKNFGLSPPPAFDGMLTMNILENAVCPKCQSTKTKLINPFGPTACRAIHHCLNCKETFEQFKPL